MGQLFDRMQIIRAERDGRPWSPTVVNIQRMRKQRSRKAWLTLAILVAIAVCACSGCYAATRVWQSNKAKPTAAPVAAPIVATIAATPVPHPTQPAAIKMTPMPGYGGMVQFNIEPISKTFK
jgi:hypothetical protein